MSRCCRAGDDIPLNPEDPGYAGWEEHEEVVSRSGHRRAVVIQLTDGDANWRSRNRQEHRGALVQYPLVSPSTMVDQPELDPMFQFEDMETNNQSGLNKTTVHVIVDLQLILP